MNVPLNEDNKLKLLKMKIKTWESEYLKIHFKKPTKEDISNAPDDVKESYRNYWKLKNKLGESTTDIKMDNVWSENLNKSNLIGFQGKANVPLIKNICNKIKLKSTMTINEKNPCLPVKKQFMSTEKITSSTTIKDENDSNKAFENSNCSDGMNSFSCKISAFNKPQVPIESKRNKTVQCVNLMATTIGLNPTLKSLHFDQKVNEEWLERCSLNLSNDTNLAESDKLSEGLNDFNTSSLSRTKISDKELQKYPDKLHCTFFTSPEKNVKSMNKSENVEEMPKRSQVDSPNHNLVNDSSSINLCSETIPLQLNEANNLLFEKTITPPKVEPTKNEDQSFKIKQAFKKQKLTKNLEIDSGVSKKVVHLKRKMASGTLSENFVRLDIKKKKFSRGHRSINTRKLKWNKWKQLKKSQHTDTNITGCFKCGQLGHWAKNCNSTTYCKRESNNTFEENEDIDISLPTLEEAAKLIQEKNYALKSTTSFTNDKSNNKIDDLDINGIQDVSIFDNVSNAVLKGSIEPLYELDDSGNLISTPKAVYDVLNEMGYSCFREGQETAVMRILSGLSTLVVLPTGSGKTLCYQLPAYMYTKYKKSIAIVVSPLLSLMEDQVTGLSSCLHAVCLHSGMSDIEKTKAMDDIICGHAQIVLVSPEAVISYGFTEKFLDSKIPPISFACIDEVHCLSQWSHNFRPSYLQLYKVLTQKLDVKCILGLTATATCSAVRDITTHLGLKTTENSVVGYSNVPSNLHLSISRDKDKDRALIQLLKGDRFHKCSSIIVYCIRRVETERIAALIRTCMQDEVESNTKQQSRSKAHSKKRNFIWTAEAYHAGLAPPRRRSIQKKFMSGKLRVVVATVAFGMGLDKSDVRAIIHFNMPNNFESYVQEIGRAGRDGLDSHCHLFLDSEGNDLWEQQRHIYSNGIDRYTLRKLLQKVFVPCKCSSLNAQLIEISEMKSDKDVPQCPKHEVAFSINDTVQELDLKQENISTLLCYLELHSSKWIEILSPTYATCSIRCYGGSQQMHSIALKNPLLAAAIALDDKKREKSSQYTFSVINVANALGCKSSILKRELKKLEWNGKKKTGVVVEFSDLSFHILAPGNLSNEEMDLVLDFLYNKVNESEKSQLRNLKLLFSIFQRYSSSHYWECCDDMNTEYSEKIKIAINKYFDHSDMLHDEILDSSIEKEDKTEEDISFVKQLIKDIICTHHDQNFTGRAIARIFHGISSPCFPSEVWGRVRKFWRCLLFINFNTIMKMANEELRHFKGC